MVYASYGLLAIIIQFIINHDMLKTEKKGGIYVATSCYRQFLLCVSVYYLSDALWGIMYENKWIKLVYADTVVYFLTMVVSVLLWTRYVVTYLDKKSFFVKVITYSGWAILWFEVVGLIINFYYPVLFYFDKNDNYIPGSGRYMTLGLQVLLFVGISAYTLIESGKKTGKVKLHYVAVGFSGVVMTIFIIVQTLFPLLPFYAIGCLLATCLVHAFVVENHERELGTTRQKVYVDSLTGAKSSHAYVEMKELLDQRIKNGTVKELGIIVFDLNDLKTINDTYGHEEGDRYIKSACAFICETFTKSPVFRIGGDEFVVLLEGEDFERKNKLLASFDRQIEKNKKSNKLVVSSGLSVYIPNEDNSFEAVFERADSKMYERKRALKGM